LGHGDCEVPPPIVGHVHGAMRRDREDVRGAGLGADMTSARVLGPELVHSPHQDGRSGGRRPWWRSVCHHGRRGSGCIWRGGTRRRSNRARRSWTRRCRRSGRHNRRSHGQDRRCRGREEVGDWVGDSRRGWSNRVNRLRSLGADNSLVGRIPGGLGSSSRSGDFLGGFAAGFLGGALGVLGGTLQSRWPFAGPSRRNDRSNDWTSIGGNLGVDIVEVNRTPKKKKKRGSESMQEKIAKIKAEG
jgi:hypothetical protein